MSGNWSFDYERSMHGPCAVDTQWVLDTRSIIRLRLCYIDMHYAYILIIKYMVGIS